jgi:hypothetical protein
MHHPQATTNNQTMFKNITHNEDACGAFFHKECPQHHGRKGDTRDLWRHWWEGPSDPSVGEGPMHLKRLPLMGTRSHEGKAIS